MRLLALLLAATLASACSSDQGSDIPPLPKQDAESANALMREAEGAANNAQARLEQTRPAVRSTATTNEVTP